jgi:uncharacterized RDD family membrane protein YckC
VNRKTSDKTFDSTSVNHSLANTIGRITEENPKRIKGLGATIDLSRKTTKDIPSLNAGAKNSYDLEKTQSQADELLARIAAIEKSEQQSKAKTVCRSCKHVMPAEEKRLTCLACGQYLETAVSEAENTIWNASFGQAVKRSLVDFGLDASNVHDQEKLAQRKYMARRLFAKVIDTVIVASIIALEVVLSFAVTRSLMVIPQAAPLLLILLSLGVPLMALITVLGYQAAFESSPVQATPGKFWLGLYVTSADGAAVRCEQVIGKTLLSLLPTAAFILVYAYFYNSRLQFGLSLDGPSASVLAMTTLACIVTALAMNILVGPASKRQTITDLLSGSLVRER